MAPGAHISPIELLPIRPDHIITELLRMKLERPEEIGEMIPGSTSMIGGILDRRNERFIVAGQLPLACQRFTLAHELGHFFLHPGLIYHRDLPVIGVERGERGRPPLEEEADRFAAEILIPPRTLRDVFVVRYRKAISPDEIDENMAFRLTMGSPASSRLGTITVDMLVHGKRRFRSRIIATDTHAGPSLVELFAVSRESMAIQLEDLDLVF